MHVCAIQGATPHSPGESTITSVLIPAVAVGLPSVLQVYRIDVSRVRLSLWLSLSLSVCLISCLCMCLCSTSAPTSAPVPVPVPVRVPVPVLMPVDSVWMYVY